VGQYLARGHINISSFNLSRNKKGGRAMAIVSVDSQIPAGQLKQLKDLPNVESAKALFL
jgi:D-3-phosphoglycerate dehydrogenase